MNKQLEELESLSMQDAIIAQAMNTMIDEASHDFDVLIESPQYNELVSLRSDTGNLLDQKIIVIGGYQYIKRQCIIVSEWWRKFLSSDTSPGRDWRSPPETDADMLGQLIILANTEIPNIDEDKINRFQHELSITLFSHAMESFGRGLLISKRSSYHVHCGVDYHPDGILAHASEQAGFKCDSILPWKTITTISPMGIIAREGHSGVKQELQSYKDLLKCDKQCQE